MRRKRVSVRVKRNRGRPGRGLRWDQIICVPGAPEGGASPARALQTCSLYEVDAAMYLAHQGEGHTRKWSRSTTIWFDRVCLLFGQISLQLPAEG